MLAGARPFNGEDGTGGRCTAILTREPDVDGDVLSRRARRDRPRLAPGARESPDRALRVDVAPGRGAVRADGGSDDGSAVTRLASVDAPRACRRPSADARRCWSPSYRTTPSLVDQMTPIDAQRLIARLRDTAVDVVREYGGLVNQAIGEEIVSLFGVPIGARR